MCSFNNHLLPLKRVKESECKHHEDMHGDHFVYHTEEDFGVVFTELVYSSLRLHILSSSKAECSVSVNDKVAPYLLN